MQFDFKLVIGKKVLCLFLLAGLFFTLWIGWKYPIGERCDFQLFYHELQCFREGVDPHSILTGKRDSDKYYPYKSLEQPSGKNQVAYRAPWLYTMGGWMGVMPLRQASVLILLLNVLAWASAGLLAYFYAKTRELSPLDSLLAALIGISFWYPVSLCLQVGNVGNLAALGALGMALAIGKGRKVLAGICLTILMFKIQAGAIFLIPLLMRKEWKVIVTAGLLTFGGCIYPCLASGTPIWEIIGNIAFGVSYLEVTNGGLLSIFIKVLSQKQIILGDLLICLPLCLYASFLVRKEKDPLLPFLPAAVFALLWTYSWPHDRLLLVLPLLYFTVAFFQKPTLLYGAGMAVFLAENGEMLYHTLVRYGAFDPAGKGFLYHGYNFLCFLSWIFFLFFFLYRRRKELSSAGENAKAAF